MENKENVLILHNSVICLDCGEKLVSRHRHDYQSCECGSFVDGGLDYVRYGGNVQVFTITTEDKFEEQRFYFERGTYGKNGDEPLHYIKLKDMTTEHIEAVIEYTPNNLYNKIYQKELKYRDKKKN